MFVCGARYRVEKPIFSHAGVDRFTSVPPLWYLWFLLGTYGYREASHEQPYLSG
jgi:hypothetical protein